MTKVKICGLRRPEDVAMVNRWRPDYAGFVFAAGKRQVTKEQARALRQQLDPAIPAVGVFVRAAVDVVSDLVNVGIIQLIQLHGDEDAGYIAELRKRTKAPIIKVIRVKEKESLEHLETWDCEYFLLDAFSKSQYGGLGKTFDHNLLKDLKLPKPFFLAGGLNEGNIEDALTCVHPYAVDTSSGVETDGVKDEEKIRGFIRAVRKEEQP